MYAHLNSESNKNPIIKNLGYRFDLYIDSDGVIRIKSKIGKKKVVDPILLLNKNNLTDLIIRDVHEKYSHSKIYGIMRRLKGHYWIESPFSAIKRVLKLCVFCQHPVQLNFPVGYHVKHV